MILNHVTLLVIEICGLSRGDILPTPSDLINTIRDLVVSTGLRLILEPGRSMVATSSALVNTVRLHSQRYLQLDPGPIFVSPDFVPVAPRVAFSGMRQVRIENNLFIYLYISTQYQTFCSCGYHLVYKICEYRPKVAYFVHNHTLRNTVE